MGLGQEEDTPNVIGCKHVRLVYDENAGEKVCEGCAAVVEQKVEVFISKDKELLETGVSRRGEPMILDSSIVPHLYKRVDAHGHAVNDDVFPVRLQKADNITMAHDSKVKNLRRASRVLLGLCEAIHASETVEDRAMFIYRKVLAHDMTRGRTIAGLVGASVYVAAKESNMPVSLKEIQQLVGPEDGRVDVSVYVKILARELHISAPRQEGNAYVSKVVNTVSASAKVERRANEIVSQVQGLQMMCDKTPASIAAGAVYLAALELGEHVTQMHCAVGAGCSTVSLRKRVVQMANALKIDPKIFDKAVWNEHKKSIERPHLFAQRAEMLERLQTLR